jgi:hypothetical protein
MAQIPTPYQYRTLVVGSALICQINYFFRKM